MLLFFVLFLWWKKCLGQTQNRGGTVLKHNQGIVPVKGGNHGDKILLLLVLVFNPHIIYQYNICFMQLSLLEQYFLVYCYFLSNFHCTPVTLSIIFCSMVLFSTMEQRYVMQYGSCCSSRPTRPCNSNIYCFSYRAKKPCNSCTIMCRFLHNNQATQFWYSRASNGKYCLEYQSYVIHVGAVP
jgi:hypothetical protein